MARKRLSDLLREEAQKSLPDNQGDATNEPPVKEQKPKSQRDRSSQPTPAVTADAATDTTTEPSTGAADQSETTSVAELTPVEAVPAAMVPEAAQVAELTTRITELEDTIADLQATLRTTQRTETVLREEITQLQASLRDQQELTQQLQKNLEQANRHEAELEQAKQFILKLSEENMQLVQALEAAKREQVTPNTTQATNNIPTGKDAQTVNRSPQNGTSQPSPSAQAAPATSDRSRVSVVTLQQILKHPIQAEPLKTTLTNEEMGWVD
jgi:chromosome segregation ATPase